MMVNKPQNRRKNIGPDSLANCNIEKLRQLWLSPSNNWVDLSLGARIS